MGFEVDDASIVESFCSIPFRCAFENNGQINLLPKQIEQLNFVRSRVIEQPINLHRKVFYPKGVFQG